jgi:hypothetical protein
MDIFIHLSCRHFSRRQAAASLALLVHLRKPAKLAKQTSLRDGLRLAGEGVCCRSHQSVCLISLRKRSKGNEDAIIPFWMALHNFLQFRVSLSKESIDGN